MNERIRELYRQAHSIRHYDGDPAREGNPPTVYWQGDVSAGRFAELLIGECYRVCMERSLNTRALKIDRENIALAILDHFGIKHSDEMFKSN